MESVTSEPSIVAVELMSYYKFHKFLLSIIGLWPYHRSKLQLVQNILINLIIASVMIPQFLVYLRSDITLLLILKGLSTFAMCVGAFFKYNMFWYYSNRFKKFMDEMMYDWKRNQDETLNILRKHACRGKYYGKLIASTIFPSVIGPVLLMVWNIVRNSITTVKDASFSFPIMMNYLVDERKYYFLISGHQFLSMSIGTIIFVATESLMIMLLQHCAGLFTITSYYMKKAVLQDSACCHNSENPSNNKSKRTLITAVVLHRRAIKFTKDVKTKNAVLYTVLIILGIISLSASMYRLSQSFLSTNVEEKLIPLVFVVSLLSYMFYLNYMVQQVLDSANNIITLLYNTSWYETSIDTRRMLLFIMLKSCEECDFTFCNVYCASVEGFSTLLRNSISGLMAMSSLQDVSQ